MKVYSVNFWPDPDEPFSTIKVFLDYQKALNFMKQKQKLNKDAFSCYFIETIDVVE